MVCHRDDAVGDGLKWQRDDAIADGLDWSKRRYRCQLDDGLEWSQRLCRWQWFGMGERAVILGVASSAVLRKREFTDSMIVVSLFHAEKYWAGSKLLTEV